MPTRIAPLLVVVILLAGLRSADAQPAQPRLSTAAQAAARYLLTDSELPQGFRRSTPLREVTNEDLVGANGGADLAPLVVESRRMTEIGYTARGATPRSQLSMWIGVFADAEGAWHYAANYAFPHYYPAVERTLLGADVGQRSVLYHWTRNDIENFLLMFQRDRLAVEVIISDAPGRVAVQDILPVAQAIDAKIVASPPGLPTEVDMALVEQPTPSVVIRGAARLFLRHFVDELDPAQLYREGWEGATRALQRAGVTNLPPMPDYPSDWDAAAALHMQTFPLLEMLAGNRLTQRQLAYAAINAMVAARNDCHTTHRTPEQWQQDKVADVGGQRIIIGFTSQKEGPNQPWRILSITPHSPAQRAGLRRGQIILELNGRSVAGLTLQEASDLLDRREGAPNTFVLQNPSGSTVIITVAPGPVVEPPLEARVLPGSVGVLRFYSFQVGTRQLDLMRQALEEFEAQGVQGWILDLRGNSGGAERTLASLTSLFIEGGRLYGSITRGQQPVFTSAAGNALPFQRPLVILTDRGSASSGEIMPGALQARGRAILVGERTRGCIGGYLIGTGLLDHSVLNVTSQEIVIGPDAERRHRVGISPNVEVSSPTPEEEELGIDRQVDAAVDVLRELIGSPGQQMPAPAQMGKALATLTN